MLRLNIFGAFTLLFSSISGAALITDANDSRTWQAATVGTFADLYYGTNSATTRQQVVDDELLDDSYFNFSGYSAATLVNTPWLAGGGGGCRGISHDTTGTGSFAYTCTGNSTSLSGNTVDNLWFQSSSNIGDTIFDLGFQATKAAVFNSIDHGPLPQEAIESTVWLSNDMLSWTQAVTERVWLEGFESNAGILWDGFTYAVGTGTNDTFRYASTTWGGPGALISDGDDEINAIMGLNSNFTQDVPEPSILALFCAGIFGLGFVRRRKLR